MHSHSSSAKSSLSKASTVESSGSSSGDVSTIIKKESNNTLKINIKRIFTEQISNFKAFSDQDKSEEKVEIIKKKVKCEELVQSSCSGTKSLFEEEFHSKSKKVQQFNKEAPPKSGLASLFQKTPQKKNSENSFSLLNDLLGI